MTIFYNKLNFIIMSSQVLTPTKETTLKIEAISDNVKNEVIKQYKETLTESELMSLMTDKTKALILDQNKKSQSDKRALQKANQSILSKNRTKLNNSVKAELLNFDDVFNTVIKKEFSFLTARPTLIKVSENLDTCIVVLFSLCSDSFKKQFNEEKKVINWERLSRLITDKKLLLTFATDLQKTSGKIWGATQIIDLLFKALTVKDNAYEIGLQVRKVK